MTHNTNRKKNKKAYPPGELLADEIEARGKKCKTCGHFQKYTQVEFCKDAGLSQRCVSEIINNRRRIRIPVAKKIAKALGTSWEIWVGLQNDYDIYANK